MTLEFDEQRVVITGGSQGIGLATAKILAARGARVVVASRSADNLAAAKSAIGGAVETHVLDVTREVDVKAFFAKVGAFDHLVTPASGAVMGPFLELDTGAARMLLEAKFWGQYHAVEHGAPGIRPGGSITLFSGIVSRKPMAGATAYGAIAGAIESMARILALELQPIRVNVVTPGVIDTPAWAQVVPDASARTAMLGQIAASLPVKRVGEPVEVAEAVLFLMRNRFITGAVVDVDGGHRVI